MGRKYFNQAGRPRQFNETVGSSEFSDRGEKLLIITYVWNPGQLVQKIKKGDQEIRSEAVKYDKLYEGWRDGDVSEQSSGFIELKSQILIWLKKLSRTKELLSECIGIGLPLVPI